MLPATLVGTYLSLLLWLGGMKYTQASVAAQERFEELDGRDRLHFCGAYWGWGFHEDGVRSGVAVVRLADASSFRGIGSSIRLLGAAVGESARAEALVKDVDAHMGIFAQCIGHTEQEDHREQVPLHLLERNRPAAEEIAHDRVVEDVDQHEQVEDACGPSHHVGEPIEDLLDFEEHEVPLHPSEGLPASAGSPDGTSRYCP